MSDVEKITAIDGTAPAPAMPEAIAQACVTLRGLGYVKMAEEIRAALAEQVAETDRLRDVVAMNGRTLLALSEDCQIAEKEQEQAESRAAELQGRLEWLANRVLACDYGDNEKPGEIGWRIRHDLLPANPGERQPAFMFGKSIDAAIDRALKDDKGSEG